jgi:hypothetical protein
LDRAKLWGAIVSYEVLVVIVAINAVATLSLWRQMANKVSRPTGLNKKAAKALYESAPIVPRHDPPKVVGGGFPLVNDIDRAFFADFKEFADVVNWLLADKYVASRFRLQDLPDGTVSIDFVPDGNSDPIPGRCFALYYNQTRVGRLEIHPSYNYTTETPQVYTSVQIDWARLLGYRTLTDFLTIIADHVTGHDGRSEGRLAARQSIERALMETLWNKYGISPYDRFFDEDLDWGELNVSFAGSADWYIARRTAWHKTSAKNGANAGPSPKA